MPWGRREERRLKRIIHSLSRDLRLNLLIVFTLAISLSVNTTVFSMVRAILVKAIPFTEMERLVHIEETKLPEYPRFTVAPGNFFEWQKQSTSFESLDFIVPDQFNLLEGGTPESVTGAVVTPTFWPALGIHPELGRGISKEEIEPGKEHVALISHNLWVRRFNSDPKIINRTITIDSQPFAVIGVMPQQTGGLSYAMDLWMPAAIPEGAKDSFGNHQLMVLGRLKENISIEQASAELTQIAQRLETTRPDTNKGWSVRLTPLRETIVGNLESLLLLLWGAVMFVLLIACANIAHLWFVRSVSRSRELSIRLALGATRFQIVRELLAESVVLAMAGGAVGILMAYGEMHILIKVAKSAVGGWGDLDFMGLDPTVLAFATALSAASGILFGLIPAIHMSRTRLSESLKQGARTASTAREGQRLRNAFVLTEVSLALILLVGAGLAALSFIKLSRVDPGFDTTNVLIAGVTLPSRKYSDPAARWRFTEKALQEVSTLPGVISVAASSNPPFLVGGSLSVAFEDRPPAKPGEDPGVVYFAISQDYFKALGIPLKRGRFFSGEDHDKTIPVTIVNERFVARFYPNGDALGKRIRVASEDWREIVGIVGDTRQDGLDQGSAEQVYDPLAQLPSVSITLIVKAAVNPMPLARAIEEGVQSADREQPVTSIRLLQQVVNQSIGLRQVVALLLGVLGAIALLIAVTGVYGVMAYSVSKRTNEIGIRMALGADRARVIRLVLGQGMLSTIAGLAVGIAGALLLTQFLQGFLYETSAVDAATFAGAAAILALASLLACYILARRASKMDPVVALRHD
jgi:putative ABC transport system permease protein